MHTENKSDITQKQENRQKNIELNNNNQGH